MRARRSENADQALPCVRSAADDLHDARAGFHLTNPKLVGIRMRRGFEDAGDGEIFELAAWIVNALDLKSDKGQL